ncbi:RimK/LysX family protein [Vibrio rhizosphaerae]|uniref:RimK/LysX family protein n=1 Tax=Vibrio rhizosphaerae TaxID=398736 RepID=A0ABU4IXY1_9VIBR|nr:RimK/LysX family protein [Vibrio rhizosphaerae]MDW6094261.1 RimK/LysX family protein [Vibrio rhizosphaerae]
MKRPWKSWITLMLLSGVVGCSNTRSVEDETSTTQQDASHADRETVMQQIDQSYGYEFAPQSDVATQETVHQPTDVSEKASTESVGREHVEQPIVADRQTSPDATVTPAEPSGTDQKGWVYLPGVDEKFPAQLDRDAEMSQLSTTDVNYFRRSGQEWVQFRIQSDSRKSASVSLPIMRWIDITSTQSHAAQRHPVVVTWIEFGKEIKERTEFMLTDTMQRTRFPVRLGQSLFRDMASHETEQTIDIFN